MEEIEQPDPVLQDGTTPGHAVSCGKCYQIHVYMNPEIGKKHLLEQKFRKSPH
jgi:hypothetical protein